MRGFVKGVRLIVLGLMYYNYRHYEPVTGRWLLSDPIDQGEGEYDRYCFCMNNPASVCDRCGLYTLGDASGSLSQRGVLPLGKKIMNISIPDNVIKHFLHDLEPFWYARDLGRIGDYYAVRPSW